MARERAHAFDEATALGLADMLSEHRRSPRGRSPSQYTPPAPSGGECVLLRITSATPTSGLYPCVPLFWDYDDGYSDGDAAWALMPNSETPTDERRYLGRRMTVKAADGKLVYAVAHSGTAVPASLVDDGIILNTYQLIGGLKDWRGGAYIGTTLVTYPSSSVVIGGALVAGYSADWDDPTYPVPNAAGLTILGLNSVDGGAVIGVCDSSGMLLADCPQIVIRDDIIQFKGEMRLSDGVSQFLPTTGTVVGLEFQNGWLCGGTFDDGGTGLDGTIGD